TFKKVVRCPPYPLPSLLLPSPPPSLPSSLPLFLPLFSFFPFSSSPLSFFSSSPSFFFPPFSSPLSFSFSFPLFPPPS
ncbi:hypothetical protein ACXWR7_13425, partial [Streptococcus pyogenes]